MKTRLPYRGLGETGEFANRFVIDRISGFEKDIGICLTPVPSKDRKGLTHAYFPALSACLGTLEYMAGLYKGNIAAVGWKDVFSWAVRYMPQPDYDEDVVRVLVEAFRNSIAHRGIASGVWIDNKPREGEGRRFTWNIHASSRRPSISFNPEVQMLRSDPPWDCPYTHRAQIHLPTLFVDIRNGAHSFGKELAADPKLSKRFFACMKQLYPQ